MSGATRRDGASGPVARALGLPVAIALLAAAAFAGLRLVPVLDRYRPQLDRIEAAMVVGVGVWLAHRVLATLLDWTQRGGPRVQLLPLGRRALGIAALAIGVLLVLDQLDVEISPLLAGLGISGIAVALALQPLLTNLFAGSYVLSDASIRVGDFIALQGGPTGRVEDIGWRATRLRDLEGDTVIIVPNATLASATVTNFGTAGATLAAVTLTLPRDTDLEAAERLALDALRRLMVDDPRVLPDAEPVLRFQALTADAVTCFAGVRTSSQAHVPAVTHALVKALASRLGAKRAAATAEADS